MKKLLESSTLLALIAVIASLVASVAAFLWGALRTVEMILNLLPNFGDEKVATVSMISLMDTFLIAAALLIFALALYELFIQDLQLPAWLVIRDIHGLKVMLSNVIILVMGVTFLKKVIEGKDPEGTLLFGIAIALVSGALILFSRAEPTHNSSHQEHS